MNDKESLDKWDKEIKEAEYKRRCFNTQVDQKGIWELWEVYEKK